MKFRIMQVARSALQINSDFMNKIGANDLKLPPSSPNLIILFFQAMDFTVVDKEESVEEKMSLFICTKCDFKKKKKGKKYI